MFLQVIQLHFLNFDLGNSSNCSSSSVRVYDGNDVSAPLLQTFCGQSLPGDVTSSGNTLFVHFKIVNVMTYDGFTIYYSGLSPVEGMATYHLLPTQGIFECMIVAGKTWTESFLPSKGT